MFSKTKRILSNNVSQKYDPPCHFWKTYLPLTLTLNRFAKQRSCLFLAKIYVTCSGVTGYKLEGRCFSSVHQRMTNYSNNSLCTILSPAKHNATHHWRCAFMSDSFYNSQVKPLLFKKSSTVSRYECPELLYWIKIACTVDSYFIRNLSLWLVPCFARAGHILESIP